MLEQFWDKNRVIADMRFYMTADLRFASYYADNYGKKRLFKIDFLQSTVKIYLWEF